MKKIVINGFVHVSAKNPWDADGQPKFTFFNFDASGNELGYVMVGPASFEYELPEGWRNIVAAEVSCLEAQKAAALAAYQKSVAAINDSLSKLQALTNDTAPAAPDANA